MPGLEPLILGEKTVVVFDIGATYTKCGFAGESNPRFIFPTEITLPSGCKQHFLSLKSIKQKRKFFHRFFHRIYYRHLLVNPKDRRVVIVESILCTSALRDLIADVLYNHFEIPSALFAPAHLVTLFTLGLTTALVLDCGYNETCVIPVCEGYTLLDSWQAAPLGSKAIHESLSELLVKEATMIDENGVKHDLSYYSENLLTLSILEDLKVRTCFVSPATRAEQWREWSTEVEAQSVSDSTDNSESKSRATESVPTSERRSTYSDFDLTASSEPVDTEPEILEVDQAHELAVRSLDDSISDSVEQQFEHVTLEEPNTRRESEQDEEQNFDRSVSNTDEQQQSAAASLQIESPKVASPYFLYPLTEPNSSKCLQIPSRIRELSLECLFTGDSDNITLATLILRSILRSPIDVRRRLAENLVFVGGTVSIPGFTARLMEEINSCLDLDEFSTLVALKGTFRLHSPPAHVNYVAWLGGAIFGALESLPGRSLDRGTYLKKGFLPDWTSIIDNLADEEEGNRLTSSRHLLHG